MQQYITIVGHHEGVSVDAQLKREETLEKSSNMKLYL